MLDLCAPERTCASNCSTSPAEVCYFECVCAPGFERDQITNQCMDIDECLVQPCLNGATCTNLINNYVCTCAIGFKGRNCEQLNDCEPNPCQNGATCVDFGIGFICECVRRWDDHLCDSNIDDCTANSYLNGGTCMDLVDDFQCSCPPGFTGRRCEIDIPECSLIIPCRNGGLCLERPAGGGYECFCVNGWTGEHCEQSVNDCAEQPCRNRGSCIDGFQNYTCNCTVGYKGENCDYDIDECLSDPCLNEGTCYDLPNGVFYCHCPSGYFGL